MDALIDPEDVDLMATFDDQGNIDLFCNDQSKLDPKKKVVFIMMSSKGVVDNFDALTSVPYSEFTKYPRKGFNKTKFFPTNEMLAKEIRHHDPNRRLNFKEMN